jgi:cytochrome bd ubiquinol oxidase subunit I
MIENMDLTMVDWSRAQFALTAMFHWVFVPLTLGITFIIAIMETIYVKTGKEEWAKMTRFWMKLFGINFAIGVATGLILEFEFGTNWSNYSWFVGDIFGAPLAIEGIFAFFLESTFIAVMFFGWKKVNKKFHLLSSWLVAFGANLSALWILVANGWMQYPAGMHFNPDSARNEMLNFWEVFLSPVAINKFLHTISSAYVLSAIFVIGVSSWFLLKKREQLMAKRSIVIASVFGIITSLFLIYTGDGSAYQVAQKQPVKLAAMEGLYDGSENAGLVVFGILNPGKSTGTSKETDEFIFKVEIPSLLSILGYRSSKAFVPGINDLVYGNEEQDIISVEEKIRIGTLAKEALKTYKKAKKEGNESLANKARISLEENFRYFGYAFLNHPESVVPNVPITFYSFHIMVMLGFYFMFFFILVLFLALKDKLENKKMLHRLAILSIPLAYIASQSGWIVAEVGRQPWVIQDIMPTMIATSHLDAATVQITFWIFSVLFSVLLIAELKIMFKQIKIGPDH